ncbi:hypothetical protein BDZ94DRAFT_1256195, partial [Collybia nuda]
MDWPDLRPSWKKRCCAPYHRFTSALVPNLGICYRHHIWPIPNNPKSSYVAHKNCTNIEGGKSKYGKS